jgi:hypothetical protein
MNKRDAKAATKTPKLEKLKLHLKKLSLSMFAWLAQENTPLVMCMVKLLILTRELEVSVLGFRKDNKLTFCSCCTRNDGP